MVLCTHKTIFILERRNRMQEKNLREIITIYNQICEEINKENKDKNIQYEVLQQSTLLKEQDYAKTIEALYKSFHKNKDFIHIPDTNTIENNSFIYPSLIARRKDNKQLLGIATIKYFENTANWQNPYFPFEHAKHLELSGLIVREDNILCGFPGVGKTICEIALMGASIYHRYHKDTRMMTVIDARNAPSVNAMRAGLRMIKENQRFGEDKELSGHIAGYYEVHDFETNHLTEAQTLVIEFDLTPSEITEKENITLELWKQENEDITTTIEGKLQNIFHSCGITKNKPLEDPDCGNVVFCAINNTKQSRIENFTVIPHNSALGNDRMPSGDRKMVYTYARQ